MSAFKTGLVMILFMGFFHEGGWAYERLDPHGERELRQGPSCTVCHEMKKDRVVTKSGTENLCQTCHNKSPHSGVAEHLGKKWGTEKMTCLSCHSPHRANSLEGLSHGKVFLLRDQIEGRPKNAMLKRTCTDCHKW